MNNLSNISLAEIVTENYNAAKIFEKYSLDFCCKGNRTLKAACEEKNVETELVVKEIANLAGYYSRTMNFDAMNLSNLADYIVNVHHHYVKENMHLILQYLDKVALKHGNKFTYMKSVSLLFSQLSRELNEHLKKEEEVVFPLIKNVEQYQVVDRERPLRTEIMKMEEEHDAAGSIMHQIKEMTGEYHLPENACTTFRLCLDYLKAFELDLHKHVYLENHVLFPRALMLENNMSSK